MITKNIVFHFYAPEGFENNEAIKIHLACLKRYSHIFDNALFIISVNDINDTALIGAAEKAIIDCGFRNIKFKVSENDCYCEAVTFKKEIIDKLGSFDGITFFGHTKGVTNVVNPNMDKISVLKWVAGMYYLNLNFVEEAESVLVKEFKYSMFGAYKVVDDKIENANRRWYAGTFYWINTNRLANNMKQRGIQIPRLHDRGYAEFIAGELDNLGSHGDVYLFPFDYDTAGFLIDFLLLNDGNEIAKYREYEKELGI